MQGKNRKATLLAAALICIPVLLAPWPRITRKTNLWRINLTNSCTELLREQEVVEAQASNEPGGSSPDLGVLLYKIELSELERELRDRGVNCNDLRRKIAMGKLGESIEQINLGLDARAARLPPDEALLWPIRYAENGQDYAAGSIVIIQPDQIIWNNNNQASISTTHYSLEDWGNGPGVEERESTSYMEVDCLNVEQQKLCNRLRALSKKEI